MLSYNKLAMRVRDFSVEDSFPDATFSVTMFDLGMGKAWCFLVPFLVMNPTIAFTGFVALQVLASLVRFLADQVFLSPRDANLGIVNYDDVVLDATVATTQADHYIDSPQCLQAIVIEKNPTLTYSCWHLVWVTFGSWVT